MWITYCNHTPPFLTVFDEKRVFCCHGCKAVCEAIIASGNADYYKHREGEASTFQNKSLPELLDKLKIYDNEKIQKEFVSSGSSDNNSNGKYKEAWLILEEIRCAACLWLNERTLRSLQGVIDVQMDYTGQQLKVRWNPEQIKLSSILSAITRIGYVAHPFDPSQRESLNQEQKQRSIQRIIFALILGMVVMQTAIASYFYGDPDAGGKFPLWVSISRWTSLFTTAAILLYPGQLFFHDAWRDLKNKTLGMDVPIALGLLVAWLGSLYNTITKQGDVYFESIAMFVLFLLIARHIELRSRISATALLDRSAKIIPQSVMCFNQGKLVDTPVVELSIGDMIQLSAGDTVPLDTKLLSSHSSFDESLLSGESLPVYKRMGDTVFGGSINIDQVIELEVTSLKAESTFNAIHQLTQQSINHRPYYVDIAEKVAAKFVAIILIIAIGTYLYWYFQCSPNALSNMIAVLIVTCPCALALAAPVALSLGAAGLSKMHVLPMRMSSIEKLSQVDTLAFDKTGTLTTGTPTLKAMLTIGDLEENVYLGIAASLEKGSHHPFAKAILSAAASANIEPSDYTPSKLEYIPGAGIKALILSDDQINEWHLGNSAIAGIDFRLLTEEIQQQINCWRGEALSILYLSCNQTLKMVFCIEDPLRDGAPEFINALDQFGIQHKFILSGDHQLSVDAVAKQLGISSAFGELSPQDKVDWLQQHRTALNSTKQKIMMLGDGINDAPTLAAADLSMTFAEATDLAKSNCDFILLGKDFRLLSSAFSLMLKTRRIILQNLGWAIAYNIIAVPAAALGYVTPWMAAIGMSLSSLLVVLNSMRLK